MEKIPPVAPSSSSRKLDDLILGGEARKRKIAKGVLNYAGIIVSVFVIFVVVVVMTTDIHLMTFSDFKDLGIAFFVLLFASCLVYVSMSSTGKRNGLDSDIYTACRQQYDELKNRFVKNKWSSRLPDFCSYYVERELQSVRAGIVEEAGISYEVYQANYIGADENDLKDARIDDGGAETEKKLSERQIRAILTANSTKPIKLTSDMLLKCGRGTRSRSPLGNSPEAKRFWNYIWKFVQITATSLLMGIIAFEVITEPNWSTFASVTLKVLTVVAQAVSGYISGYENIVIDTVNYMNDQMDLLEEAIQFIEQNPE